MIDHARIVSENIHEYLISLNCDATLHTEHLYSRFDKCNRSNAFNQEVQKDKNKH